MTTLASVQLWGRTIAAVALEDDSHNATFQYDPDFARSGIEVSPLALSLSNQVYTFPDLPSRTFYGLPGLLADSLPDRFGNALIDAWLATQGREPGDLNAVERLCYVGRRGMGALEFEPSTGPDTMPSRSLEVSALVDLASRVLTDRGELLTTFANEPSRLQGLSEILRVGTSAGGARAKAVIAWNEETQEVRSGQVSAGDGFSDWLLKFDGVRGNRDKELEDPQGYGAIEYAYHLMARGAGIEMTECRLLEENGRHHFMTKRFDRGPGGEKIHMQSLGALAHLDFNAPGAHAYEQVVTVVRALGLGMETIEQVFRRMAFNVTGRNQDDHVKNVAFLMDKRGTWSLAPAFDVTYAYNPAGDWTATHQMTLNGKRDGFTREDFREFGRSASMGRSRADSILDEVLEAIRRWEDFAQHARVEPDHVTRIAETLRLEIPSTST
jgi:serine/threonine-protein kinase HipA